ncbi:MAG: COQ9 family protein [Pelagibacteraceae bacterium]|nr:COQ9 family protein [Pelagibacteraceae bacterium]|tara:strand:- start:1485 stop:2114 length:630 start_codon:yes stop_codon:yes gene_type:complete
MIKSKQEKLVNLFIKNVTKFGWSRDTLLGTAKKMKISTSILAKSFPNFEEDVLKFIISKNNQKVEKHYKSFNHDRLRMRDRIKTILELKFETNKHLKEALPEMLKYLLRPGNILSSLKLLNDNSTFIWNLAGDNSNDISYYTKRGLLSIIYLSTLIYWLNDNSEKMIATKSFISKSVDGVVDGVSKLKQLSILKNLAQNFFDKRYKASS